MEIIRLFCLLLIFNISNYKIELRADATCFTTIPQLIDILSMSKLYRESAVHNRGVYPLLSAHALKTRSITLLLIWTLRYTIQLLS